MVFLHLFLGDLHACFNSWFSLLVSLIVAAWIQGLFPQHVLCCALASSSSSSSWPQACFHGDGEIRFQVGNKDLERYVLVTLELLERTVVDVEFLTITASAITFPNIFLTSITTSPSLFYQVSTDHLPTLPYSLKVSASVSYSMQTQFLLNYFQKLQCLQLWPRRWLTWLQWPPHLHSTSVTQFHSHILKLFITFKILISDTLWIQFLHVLFSLSLLCFLHSKPTWFLYILLVYYLSWLDPIHLLSLTLARGLYPLVPLSFCPTH